MAVGELGRYSGGGVLQFDGGGGCTCRCGRST